MKKRLLVILVILLISITGCSEKPIVVSDNITDNVTVTETNVTKESLYDQALKDIEDNATINNLNKRHDYLQNQIKNILMGEQELKMATFTRIKIELDFLKVMDYNQQKLKKLQKDFIQAFTEAGKYEEPDYSGYSLGDRYDSIESTIEKIVSGEEELKVANYLQIETELNKLGQEDFLKKKVSDLRNKLLKTVISELESASINFEIPEIEEEVQIEETEEIEEEKVAEEEELGNVINLIAGGFDREIIRIKVNETVEWKNIRRGRYNMALIVGNRECREVKSEFFITDESYNATFTEPMTCWISDGIFTTQAMRVIVS